MAFNNPFGNLIVTGSFDKTAKIWDANNGQMMHTGGISTLQTAIGHYGSINIAPGNNNLDPRLMPGGFGQQLNLTAPEVNAVIAFLKTLTGSNVYTDVKWSSPFN